MTTDALIIKGDCLKVMAGLPAASIDAIVTDPPYGLSFMGKDWDSGVPGKNFWREALRVAKPGCHLLAAGGTRTYHRLAVAIEDAGWEIRDCIMWLYGSGFPKSHDVSKAIDKAAGAEREVTGRHGGCGIKSGGGSKQMGVAAGYDAPAFTGERRDNPATEAARQWQGWGTALKPAFEPFILARKPLDGTVAENVLKHGTGGINVDGCRVGDDVRWNPPVGELTGIGSSREAPKGEGRRVTGRWPANVIHDGSDEVMAVFPDVQSGGGDRRPKKPSTFNACVNKRSIELPEGIGGDSGSASRFFYCAKASPSEREEGLNGLPEKELKAYGNLTGTEDHSPKLNIQSRNHHPTVKPVDLMKYLCRLITPPGGLILDPFCGSGSTGVAAMREGFNFIGIELNADYAEIARRRIDHERNKTPLFLETA